MKKILTILIISLLALCSYSQPIKNLLFVPEHTCEKTVRIIVHVFQNEDSIANFSNNTEGLHWIKNVLFKDVNSTMHNLKKMRLSYSGNYYKDSKIQFYIDSILFHRDDYGWDMHCESYGFPECNITYQLGDSLYEKYVVQDNDLKNKFAAIHIFMGTNERAQGMASGIGDKRWSIVSGSYFFSKTGNFWIPSGLIRHELGHNLGLVHAWNTNDGCDDTPRNAGCWNGPQCSNNMMDYNASQSALTECQLGRMHYYLEGNRGNVRDVVIEDSSKHSGNMYIIKNGDNIVWDYKKTLDGDLFIEKNATLCIKDSLFLAKNAMVFIHKKGKLLVDGGVITNKYGFAWQGFQIGLKKVRLKKAIKLGNIEINNKGKVLPYD